MLVGTQSGVRYQLLTYRVSIIQGVLCNECYSATGHLLLPPGFVVFLTLVECRDYDAFSTYLPSILVALIGTCRRRSIDA